MVGSGTVQLQSANCKLQNEKTDFNILQDAWFVSYTRRFFGGRQPLCGSGVTSSIALMVRPAACRAVMADSRPEPGPLTFTSISLTPNLLARSAQTSAARWAANGVLLRLPLKP